MDEHRPSNDSLFGQTLKEFLRRKDNLTQKKLAYKSYVPAATLSRMVRGQRLGAPSTRVHLRSIIKALHDFGVLHTVAEANRLLLTIPTFGELDERNPEDQSLMQELASAGGQEEAPSALPAETDDLIKLAQMKYEDVRLLRSTAWALYLELSTRVATQQLAEGEGSLREALNSLHAFFQEARKILRDASAPMAIEGDEPLGLLGIRLLNENLRPFTTRWHTSMKNEGINSFEDEKNWAGAAEMRRELARLQQDLLVYARRLARIAGILKDEAPPER